MTVDTDFATLQRDVRYLQARTEFLDCICRHARGHDRHDIDLLTSAYHPDGVDEHGDAINAGPEYAQWANKTHVEFFFSSRRRHTRWTGDWSSDVCSSD